MTRHEPVSLSKRNSSLMFSELRLSTRRLSEFSANCLLSTRTVESHKFIQVILCWSSGIRGTCGSCRYHRMANMLYCRQGYSRSLADGCNIHTVYLRQDSRVIPARKQYGDTYKLIS